MKVIVTSKSNILKKLKKLKSKRVAVGFPKGWNAYPDGTPVALVATVHEFGSTSQNIPARSFFRTTLVKNLNYKNLRFKTFAQVAKGRLSPDVALNRLGNIVSDDIAEAIVDVSTPALKAQTIKRKSSSNPLVDTGHLKQSVTWKVGI